MLHGGGRRGLAGAVAVGPLVADVTHGLRRPGAPFAAALPSPGPLPRDAPGRPLRRGPSPDRALFRTTRAPQALFWQTEGDGLPLTVPREELDVQALFSRATPSSS